MYIFFENFVGPTGIISNPSAREPKRSDRADRPRWDLQLRSSTKRGRKREREREIRGRCGSHDRTIHV